jgi:predicted membrane metal-binding protein
MSEHQEHVAVKIGSERSFGLVFAAVFAIVGLWPLFTGGGLRIWSLAVGAAFVAAAFAFPRVLRPLNRLWFKFGLLLGAIIAPIVMALMFFLVFTPIGLVMRLLGKDLLRQRMDGDEQSYWIPREDSAATGSMRDQF